VNISLFHYILLTCGAGAMQANAYNVALLNGGMGDGSQLLQVDQSGVMYNNLVPLGILHFICTSILCILAPLLFFDRKERFL